MLVFEIALSFLNVPLIQARYQGKKIWQSRNGLDSPIHDAIEFGSGDLFLGFKKAFKKRISK